MIDFYQIIQISLFPTASFTLTMKILNFSTYITKKEISVTIFSFHLEA